MRRNRGAPHVIYEDVDQAGRIQNEEDNMKNNKLVAVVQIVDSSLVR